MKRYTIFAILGFGILAGCSGPDATVTLQPMGAKKVEPVVGAADAGTAVAPGDPKLFEKAQQMAIVSRPNPWALMSAEVNYDRSQLAARLNQDSGFYQNVAEPREEKRQPTFINVNEPPRRLAGVLIGESISALIDMNDGKGLQVIRPGTEVKNSGGQTEWIVQSIDEEKAILRRVDPTKRPSTVVVRLQSDLGGGSSGGGGAAGGNNGGGGAPPTGGGGRRGGVGGGAGGVNGD